MPAFRKINVRAMRNIALVWVLLAFGLDLTGQTFTEFPVRPNSFPNSIVAGPDRALWFTETYGNAIGRCTLSGTITEYPLPSPRRLPWGIAVGTDGNIWFTANAAGFSEIGRITPKGVITEFPLPDPNSSPYGITAGPDGALWFTEVTGRIGRITTSGEITEFPIPSGNLALDITVGPDGNLWFLESNAQKVGSMSTAGAVKEYTVPSYGMRSITAGPDGALWFTDNSGGVIRVSLAGDGSYFRVPRAGVGTMGIVAGPDGNLWVAEYGGDSFPPRPGLPPVRIPGAIGRVTPAGFLTEFILPNQLPPQEPARPVGIAVGPDGNIWFTDPRGDISSIGKLTDVGLPARSPRVIPFR